MGGGAGRAVRRLTVALLAAVLVALSCAAPAGAHSEAVRSDPPNGGMVREGATSVTLWFDEPVGAAASSFRLRTLAGLAVPGTVTLAAGGEQVTLTTQPLARGQYVLEWHALSLADGHTSSGTVVFGAGLRPDAVAVSGSGLPPWTLLALRWVDLALLLVTIGALAVGGRVLGAGGPAVAGARARVRRAAVLTGAATAYAGIVTPLLRTRGDTVSTGAWLQQTWVTLVGTDWGRCWLAREVALVVAVVALVRWRRSGEVPSRGRGVALGALGAAVLLQSVGGHAAALPTGSATTALMSTGHVLAAGVWTGGLAVLVVTLGPVLRGSGSWPPGTRAVWRAYSPLAAVSAGVLLATGLYQAGHHVPDPAGLRTTVYGLAVSAKVVLVALALAVAGISSLTVHPAAGARLPARLRPAPDGPARLARSTAAETLLLGAAVLAAAVLTLVPTSRDVAIATRPSTPDFGTSGGLFVTFEAVPAGPDATRLLTRVRSTVQPEPAPVQGVDVRLSGPGGVVVPVALERVEDGRFEASTTALSPGAWSGEVAVHRAGLRDAVLASTWRVQSTVEAADSGFRRACSLAGWLLLALVGGLVVRARRHPGPLPSGVVRTPVGSAT